MNSWIPATNSTVSLGLPVSGKMKNNTPPVSAIAVTANKPRPCTKPGRPPRGPPSGSRPFIRRPMSDFTRLHEEADGELQAHGQGQANVQPTRLYAPLIC